MEFGELSILDRLQVALDLAGNTHELFDIAEMVKTGKAQMFADEDGIVITEVHEYPRVKVLHFWLAAGEKEAVIKQSHRAYEWARRIGCRKATLAGRKGWMRVLADEGWRASKLTLLERAL
jgi:hypothetical protein